MVSVTAPHEHDMQTLTENSRDEKRLTKVERARLEALAAFGGCGFGNLVTKKCDFQTKLAVTSYSPAGSTCTEKRLTRMQRAKLEANEAFKNIKLGDNVSRPLKRNSTEKQTDDNGSKVRKLTRLEQARVDANKAFQNVPLGKAAVKRPQNKDKENSAAKRRRVTKTKPMQNETEESFGGKSLSEKQRRVVRSAASPVPCSDAVAKETKMKDIAVGTFPVTRKAVTQGSESSTTSSKTATLDSEAVMSEKSQCEVVTLDSEAVVLNSETVTLDSHAAPTGVNSDTSLEPLVTPKRLTRVEKARLEALKCFGDQGLDDICKKSTRKLAKYLTPRKNQATDTMVVETNTTPCQTDPQPITNAQSVPGKTESARTGIPVPIPNTEVVLPSNHSEMKTRSTARYPKPMTSLYSSLDSDASFASREALLETSRRVIKAAKMLETPP